MDVAIVIPTYKEAENIRQLVPLIHTHMQEYQYCIVIVDDNSQDGIEYWYDCNQPIYPMYLLVRTRERGLSSAVIAGMKHMEADSYIVMDADMSHPPMLVCILYHSLLTHDLVVASRYVHGGGCEGWPLKRRVISRVAGKMAWGLTPVKDACSGFFGIRRECIEGIRLDGIGYKIGLEVQVKAAWESYEEIPFVFRDRQCGESKMGKRVMVEYLKHLYRLWQWKMAVSKHYRQEI